MKMSHPVNIYLFYGTGVLILTISVLRLVLSLKPHSFTDFYCHFDFTVAVWKNLDPYNLDNLILRKWDDLLIIFPGISFFYFPFLGLGTHLGKFVDLGLNIVMCCFVFFYFLKNTGLLDGISFRQPTLNTFGVILLGAVYLNSSPMMMTFRHGQITLFCTLFMLLTLFTKNKFGKIIFFGLAAGYKYSMLTLFAPAFFLKKNYLVSILAFVLFLLIAIFPLYLGNDIIHLYQRYFEVLQEDIQHGFNNYAKSGYNMLQIEFFRCNYINHAGKLATLLLVIYIMFRERKTTTFGMNYLFVLSCLTMLLSYHRLYDLSFVLLILHAYVFLLLRTRQWFKLVIASAFIGYFMLPFSAIIDFSIELSKIPGIEDFVYISKYYKVQVFPLSAVMFLFLSVYSVYLYFSNKDDVILNYGEENVEKNNIKIN
jgi:hypothetical protein